MRSNDVWLGMPYDIWCFTCIQILIAQELGVEVGSYIHQPGSLHLYEKNWEKARECRVWQDGRTVKFEWGSSKLSLEAQIRVALSTEKLNRERGDSSTLTAYLSFGNKLLSQCTLWCGIKDHKEWIEYVSNDGMKEYMNEITMP